MTERVKNVLLTVLALLLLFGFAAAVPLGSLTTEAQRAYVEEGPSNADDEYAFLFED